MKDRGIINNLHARVKIFEYDFPLFCAYHFGREFKDFHEERLLSLASDQSTFIEGFRASRKTTLAKIYIIRVIVYKKFDYIVRMSYLDTDSVSNVSDVAKMLFKPSIIRDYGQLFPLGSKMEDFAKKMQGNFDTINKVKVQSKGLQQSTRGMNSYDSLKEMTKRPQLLLMDDIDVTKSVQNQRIIEQNEKIILGEVFGALDPTKNKKVFMGNTILEDGVVPRLHRLFKTKKTRDVFRQPLIDDDGVNVRPEVFTPDVLEEIMSDGDIAFSQNYLLKPYSGQGIIKRSWIQYTNLKDRYAHIVIGVDPASSTKTVSDPLAIVICGSNTDGKKEIIKAYELKGEEKGKNEVIEFIFNAYVRHSANYIHFESVTAFKYLADDLKAKGMAVKEITPHKDKVTRLMELEGDIRNGNIRFVDGEEGIDTLITQLLLFPNGKHDDLVDAFVYSVAQEKKKYIAI